MTVDIGKEQDENVKFAKEILDDETTLEKFNINLGRFIAIIGILNSLYQQNPDNATLRNSINVLINDNLDNERFKKFIKMSGLLNE